MFVIVAGDSKHGFICIGPFACFDDADRYVKTDPYPENMRVVELDAPAEGDAS